jgi:hypothetical protein
MILLMPQLDQGLDFVARRAGMSQATTATTNESLASNRSQWWSSIRRFDQSHARFPFYNPTAADSTMRKAVRKSERPLCLMLLQTLRGYFFLHLPFGNKTQGVGVGEGVGVGVGPAVNSE